MRGGLHGLWDKSQGMGSALMKVAVVSTLGRTTQDMGRYCSAAFRRLGHVAREWVYDLERGGWVLPAWARPSGPVCWD